MNAPRRPYCTLARLQANPMDTDAIKKEAFHNDRILVVNLDEPRLTWMEAQVVEGIGEKLFGRTRNG